MFAYIQNCRHSFFFFFLFRTVFFSLDKKAIRLGKARCQGGVKLKLVQNRNKQKSECWVYVFTLLSVAQYWSELQINISQKLTTEQCGVTILKPSFLASSAGKMYRQDASLFSLCNWFSVYQIGVVFMILAGVILTGKHYIAVFFLYR